MWPFKKKVKRSYVSKSRKAKAKARNRAGAREQAKERKELKKLLKAAKRKDRKWRISNGLWTNKQVDSYLEKRRKERAKTGHRPEINPMQWRDFEEGWRPPGWHD